jgi:hypothetical protein
MSLPTLNLASISRTAASLVSPRGAAPLTGKTNAGKTVTWHSRAGDLAQQRGLTAGRHFVASLGPNARAFGDQLAEGLPKNKFGGGYELPPIDYSKVKPSPVDVRSQIKAKSAEHAGKARVDVDKLGELSSDQKAAATAFASDIERLGYFKSDNPYVLDRRVKAATEAVHTLVFAPTTFLGDPGVARKSIEAPELYRPSVKNPAPMFTKESQARLKENPINIAYEQIEADKGLSGEQRGTAKRFANFIVREYMSDFSGKSVEREDLAAVAKAAITLGKAV